MKKLLLLLVLSSCGASTTLSSLPQGIPGPAGPAGVSGTIITPIQFCPGYVTTYPSTFAEVGLCIDNQLYAVYWNGQAALTLIPPGAYTSTSTSAPCNFTVLPNCQIQ